MLSSPMNPLPVPLPTGTDGVAAVAAPDSKPKARSAPATARRHARVIIGVGLRSFTLLLLLSQDANLGCPCVVTDKSRGYTAAKLTSYRGNPKTAAPRRPGLSGPLGDVELRVPVLVDFGQRGAPDRRASDDNSARPERQAAPGVARSGASGQPAKGPGLERPPGRAPEPRWGVGLGSQEGQRVRHGHQVLQMGCAGDANSHMPNQRLFPARPARRPTRPASARAVRGGPHWCCRS